MAGPPELVCVGLVVREMIRTPCGVTGPFLGSPPAYCSVSAARQGTSTGIVTRIGPDMPHSLLQPIVDAGVDLTGLLVGDVTSASELIYDGLGNKEIRYPAKAAPIRAQDVPASYRGCQMIYVCPMDLDVPLPDLAGVAATARWSAVDLGGYGGVHMSAQSRRTWGSSERLALAVAEHFHIAKASDQDAAAIFGWDDPRAAARRLLDCGPEVVLLTLGPKGVLVYTRRGAWHVPAPPSCVLDATGGGDTFMAGFLTEMLRDEETALPRKDAVRAARWGCATAACVIEETGGVRPERMPTRHQVLSRLGGPRDPLSLWPKVLGGS